MLATARTLTSKITNETIENVFQFDRDKPKNYL